MTPEKIFEAANIDPKRCLFCHPNEGMQIFETANFTVLCCNFPASLGHMMISSKQHYGSLGELDSNLMHELSNLKENIAHWYTSNGYSILFYEHGRAGSCHANPDFGTQCEHFHLNILASPVCIHHELKNQYGNGIEVQSFNEFYDLFENWGEYLFFENSHGQAVFYPVNNNKVPSHLLRSLLCEKMHCRDRADWQKHQKYEEFLENYHFSSNLSKGLKELCYAVF